MGFLAFLFWAFVVVWLLGLVSRWLLRRWLRNAARRSEQPVRPRRKEGEVSVEQIEPTEKKIDRKVGEYIDYEEVKP